MEEINILKSFFSLEFEKEINDKMLYYSYEFEHDKVLDYVRSLLDISIEKYIDYICDNYNVSFLEAKDILQFSSFNDFSSNICKVIKEAGDKGFNVLEIGKMLENDGIERKDGAYLKYGENHSKTANELGLLFNLSNKYFLSCVGNIFNDLNDEDKIKLLTRMFLRNKLIRRLVYKWKTKGTASYFEEVGFLSESTQIRRKSNIKKIIEFIGDSTEYDFTSLVKNCKF